MRYSKQRELVMQTVENLVFERKSFPKEKNKGIFNRT